MHDSSTRWHDGRPDRARYQSQGSSPAGRDAVDGRWRVAARAGAAPVPGLAVRAAGRGRVGSGRTGPSRTAPPCSSGCGRTRTVPTRRSRPASCRTTPRTASASCASRRARATRCRPVRRRARGSSMTAGGTGPGTPRASTRRRGPFTTRNPPTATSGAATRSARSTSAPRRASRAWSVPRSSWTRRRPTPNGSRCSSAAGFPAPSRSGGPWPSASCASVRTPSSRWETISATCPACGAPYPRTASPGRRLPGPLVIHYSDTTNVVYYDRTARSGTSGTHAATGSTAGAASAGRRPTTSAAGRGRRCWSGRRPSGGPSDDWYTNSKTIYPGTVDQHLMFPSLYHHHDDTSELLLYASPDGIVWNEVPGGSVLDAGPEPWDAGCVFGGTDLIPLGGDQGRPPLRRLSAAAQVPAQPPLVPAHERAGDLAARAAGRHHGGRRGRLRHAAAHHRGLDAAPQRPRPGRRPRAGRAGRPRPPAPAGSQLRRRRPGPGRLAGPHGSLERARRNRTRCGSATHDPLPAALRHVVRLRATLSPADEDTRPHPMGGPTLR